ncbi:hypothetical protein H310_05090 [Aphanomyces invadans]|uniref:Uncharacterized protein n=1 Tax=Aphanomyces invadans TaxID=157072 RepID=A0A024UBQ8_9STRA|nr:hypothetical protein H310_05090 [Aphanomyces invadans]ETW03709.1 hypothetical protein H310_05090 [Aphanomyces invadans]|eukprot:XP_008867938.1 hypothetical protein H310_05090 [Aphanomyces invadans]
MPGLIVSLKSFKYSITGSSITTSNRSSSRSDVPTKDNEKTAVYVALARVASNVVAGMILFLPTLTLVVLITQGMFDRLVVSVNTQTAGMYWADYGKECVVAAGGWVPDTCNAQTNAVVPITAFAAIGTVLADQWSREMKEAGGSLKVTTCIIGGTANVGWANLQFIAGYDYFPDCLPTAPQDVAGMAMLETTIRDNHDEGVYFLTLYSDLDPAMTVYSYANSDGTFQNLMANPRHTIITADGQTEPDLVGGDYIIYSRPLGERYLVTGYCRTEIEELSQVKVDQGLEGWSQGKQSKLPVAPGWACGHKVSNATELIVLQVLFAIGTLVLFAGDIYITFEGFRGVLKGKPVLTYTVLSGLERRKMLLVFTVLSAMPGLLYSDVSRIYYFTENGFKIWTLSCIMIANFFSFGLVLFVSFVDMIPLRLSRVMSYSAPFFLYTSIAAITIACCNDSTYQFAYNMFYAASPLVTLHVNDADWPSGSYTAAGTPIAMSHLETAVVAPLFICFACAVFLSAVVRFAAHQCVLMNLSWCATNSFLTHVQVPNCITSLPLEQSNAIRIGSKMYCKPSTQALMGYATVVARGEWTSSRKESTGTKPNVPNFVISIYALVPSMIMPSIWTQYGKIEHNQFTPHSRAKLEKARYKHTRGACVV